MSLVYNILFWTIFILTAVIVIYYDYKYQKIPMVVLLYNYSAICFLYNPLLAVGVIFIFIAKYYNLPIDMLFIVLLCFLIIDNKHGILAILTLICYISIDNSNNKLSYMIPIECACGILLV